MLCETWLSCDVPDSVVSIPNYNLFRRDRDCHGGGLIVYAAIDLKVEVISCISVPCLQSCQSEIFSFVIPSLSCLVIAMYHPFWNNKTMHDEAIQCVTEIIDYCLTTLLDPLKARIVLCGDFNDLRLCSDEISRVTGLKQIVNFPTRGKNSLDLIFTNFSHAHPPSCLAPIGKSDHACILWSPCCVSRMSVKKQVRKISKSSLTSFYRYVNSIDWLSFVRDISDLDDAFSTFVCTLRSVFDHFFPWRIVRVRPNDKPWVRASLKLLINDRDRAFANGQTARYLRLRLEVISHIRELKARYFADIATTKNQRKIWQAIRSFSGQGSSSTASMMPSPEEFSEYFSSVFQQDDTVQDIGTSNVTFTEAFSIFEVHRLLSSLKRKSCGPDGLPHWVFRNSATSLSPAVAFLFNRSINESRFPMCLKKAIVCPIPKISRAVNVSDFRPVSLLPILSKIFEKLVSKHFILPFIRKKLTTLQFAYVAGPGSGTCCSLTLLNDRILNFLDTPGAVRVLTVDFSKAFDKILHSSIVTSAVNFRLPVNVILWLKSFLSDRFQCVRVGGTFSSWSAISSGVPQGSVLGPLLFCMVVDSFSCVSPNSMCTKYADDVTIVHFVRQSSEDNLQLEWDNVTNWSATHSLPVNRSKCSVMDIVTKKRLTLSCVIDPEGNTLKSVTNVTILGVVFSSDMKWNLYFDNIVKKASKRMYLFYNLIRAGCPSSLLLQAYLAYVRSVLLYCFPVFCNAPDYLMKRLTKIEKRIVRFTCVAPREKLLVAADAMCARLFTAVESNKAHPLRQMFCERVRTARNCLSLRPPLTRTKRYGNSFIKFARPST